MDGIPASIARDQLLGVLREAFEGPRQSWSYFSDRGPTAGFFGTLRGVDAGEASRAFGPTGNTVAGHVHHMAFSLTASTSWLRGDHTPLDWDESWRVNAVDGRAWERLQDELRLRYADLAAAIESADLSDSETFGGALGAVAHAAYHLAAIRQRPAPVAAG